MQEIQVRSKQKEELIDITRQVQRAVQDSKIRDGVCVIFTPHTTAAVTINENADPDVARDILHGLSEMVPKNGYHHGEGNSPAHIKSSLVGSSVQVLVEHGALQLGAWQGIYFCEFDGPRNRQVWIKMMGSQS